MWVPQKIGQFYKRSNRQSLLNDVHFLHLGMWCVDQDNNTRILMQTNLCLIFEWVYSFLDRYNFHESPLCDRRTPATGFYLCVRWRITCNNFLFELHSTYLVYFSIKLNTRCQISCLYMTVDIKCDYTKLLYDISYITVWYQTLTSPTQDRRWTVSLKG